MLLGVVGVKVQQVICKTYNVVKHGFMIGFSTIIGVLRTRVTPFVVLQYHRLVPTLQKLGVLLVGYLTIAVSLIKQGLIRVQPKVGQIGTQLLTIARKTLQRVKQVLKLDK